MKTTKQDLINTATAYGLTGDRLPYSSRWSGSLSVDQDFTFSPRWRGFAGGTLSYVGDRVGQFVNSPIRQIYPGYAQTNLHAGARYDAWSVTLSVNNLFDRRGFLDGGLGTFNPSSFSVTQPRTLGMSVSKVF